MKQKTDYQPEWPADLLELIVRFGKYPIILMIVISGLAFLYGRVPIRPDVDAYCVAYQIEHRKTPSNCTDQFSNPKAKLILAILTDADESTRQRLASEAFGTNEDGWSRGVWRSVYEELSPTDRLQLYKEHANFYLATSTIAQYSAALKETSIGRLNSLQEYTNAIQQYDAHVQKAFRFWTSSLIGIGLLAYLALSIMGLIVCFEERRTREENSLSASETVLIILIPPIGLLILWMITYRLWTKDLIEYLRLRFMLGKDISTLYKEFRGISHRLKTIEASSREELETQLSELRRQIDQLISTRKQTKKLLGIPEHSPASDLEEQIRGLRTRIELSLAAEGDFQQTITPVETKFAELERDESEQQQQAPART